MIDISVTALEMVSDDSRPAKRRAIEVKIDAGARILGYIMLKEDQRQVITLLLEGNDVFACLPTRYEKSLCFYCLPVIFDQLNQHCSPWSVAIVISPLHALMKEQVTSLERKGLSSGRSGSQLMIGPVN